MYNKLTAFIRQHDMVQPGDHVICAVSGGADSVALLFGMYLAKEKMGIRLSAAHFNHHLRGEESDRDARFVREFCDRFDIPLYEGQGQILPGEKGLEAAARDARYAFLRTLPGKIATAHTADDNAETLLLHLVRGTGLKGLGGITPVGENLIRPMLLVTRQEVEAFLEEFCLKHMEDSSNETDAFLRNRLRHHVLPLLKQENPRLALALSETALRLRQDDAFLEAEARRQETVEVHALRQMPEALRHRILENLLKKWGVWEPESRHIAMTDALVFSENPSARANFPGGITIERCYDQLRRESGYTISEILPISGPGSYRWGSWTLTVEEATDLTQGTHSFVLQAARGLCLRPRVSGDSLRLPGGTKSLKKLYIDRKIPASDRPCIPVLADDYGVLAVPGLGVHLDRCPEKLPALRFVFEEN